MSKAALHTRRAATLDFRLALMPLLAFGCGRLADPPADTSVQAAEQKSAVSAEAPVAATLQNPVKPAPSPPENPKPATADEIHKIIDLSKIPRMKNAEKVRGKLTELQYSYRGKLADSADFYRKTMTTLGWTEDTEPIAGLEPDKTVFLRFVKGGFSVAVSADPEQQPGMIGVHLSNQGNVDARRFPKPADAKVVTPYRHFVSYTTAANPDAAADYCRKEFTALGWKDSPLDNFDIHKKDGRTLLHFVYNAMECLVIITVKEGKTTVQYTPSIWREGLEKNRIAAAKAKGIPLPATAKQMKEAIDLSEFPRMSETKPLIATPTYLGYEATGDVAKAIAFCREKLTAAGWTEDADIVIVHEKHAMLVFSKGAFFVEVNIVQEKSPDRVTIQVSNKGNVDARLLPQSADARREGPGLYSASDYSTDADLNAAADFCRAELTKLGWTDRSIAARKTDKYIILAFTQNAMRLDIEVQKDSNRRTSVAIRTGVAGRP